MTATFSFCLRFKRLIMAAGCTIPILKIGSETFRRRDKFRQAIIHASALAIFCAICVPDTYAAQPNVVVILADDMGFSDIGCYGGEIDTPNIDSLAAGGVRFTQAYNTARCWPTRSALLTGYYAQAIRRDGMAGVQGGMNGKRPASIRLLPELLAPAGYRSYHSGKWHVDGKPLEQGFLRSLYVTGTPQYNFFDRRQVNEDGKPILASPAFYHTTAIGDHAVKCLREHAAAHAGQPFFHYVAFSAPHFPLHVPQEVIVKYVALLHRLAHPNGIRRRDCLSLRENLAHRRPVRHTPNI